MLRHEYDLETAIATWRQFHAYRRVFLPEDLDELERHLRDDIAHRQALGLDEETAFRAGVTNIGDLDGGSEEYGKVYWGKRRRQHQLTDEITWRLSMLKNYLTIALRNLRKQKGYTFINIFGLAVGLACCLLISLYVQHERSYDRYHEKADRIYRLTTELGFSGTSAHFASASPVMAEVMRAEFPEVEQSVRVINGSKMVRVGDKQFKESRFYHADSTVFDVFSYTFIAGNAQTALDRPHTVVLTHSTAQKYFGDTDPLGKTLQVGDATEYTVTGVIEDLPTPSHFQFDFLASMSSVSKAKNSNWLGNLDFKTYLVLRPDASPEALEAKFPALLEQNVGATLNRLGALFRLELQPLTAIHLHSNLDYELEPNGNVSYVYIFSAVALFILLIACINFMNLATARSADRAKEIGIRKVLGAYRVQLIRQFLVEALLLATLAFGLALVLVWLVLPTFNQIVGRSLDFAGKGALLVGFAGITGIVGLLAGSYPALFLAGFQPVVVLKGKFRTGMTGAVLRKGLVVTQFAISIMLIIGTLVVHQQLNYARSQQLGFDKDQVVVLPLYQAGAAMAQTDVFKAEVQRHPGVVHATAANNFPGGLIYDQVYYPEGKGLDESIHLWIYSVDFDYLQTLGMKLVAGRDFSPEQRLDSSSVILNETAMQLLGWDTIEDKRFVEFETNDLDGNRRMLSVIGTVEDFHFESFRHDIRPLAIRVHPGHPRHLLVRMRAGQSQEVLVFLQEKWEAATTAPFEYTFLDQQFDQLYRADEDLGRIFGYFAGLAIFIASLGLFGLTTFSVEQRTKEVGVRKVLGASVTNIVTLLSKDFLWLVALSTLIAIPVAYFAMNRWLESFAYRIMIGPSVLLLAVGIALLIALVTVSFQAVKAALADPVKSLRYE